MKKLYIKEILKYLIPIVVLMFISFFNMYNARFILSSYENYLIKQIIYYALGLLILFIVIKVNYEFIYKHIKWLYIFMNVLLLLVLLFGKEINGSKAWFDLGFVSFQPSEFMKIVLLIYLSKIFYENKLSDLMLILKAFIITMIPSVLTFLEPDTGTVLFYLIILVFMIFYKKINKWWYISGIGLIVLVGSCFLSLYFFKQDLFIKLFGTSFFYRMDRIINFWKSSGYQLENALIGIGSGGIFGLGISSFHVYFPEAVTDFVFALILTNMGLIGGVVVLGTFLYFDFLLVNDIKRVSRHKQYYIVGFLGIFLYQQIEHIMMNIGLLPITGITLPFLSYGGSSLISYFILVGFVINFKLKKY